MIRDDLYDDEPPREGCPICGVILGLALTLMLSLGVYKGIQYYVNKMPNRVFTHTR